MTNFDEMTNFGEETIGCLNDYFYTIDDIDWIGNKFFSIPIEEFFEAAYRTEYYAGYGSAEMPIDLIIFMKDGSYFERREYDGSEWWKYICVKKRPIIKTRLKVHSFNDISRYDFEAFDATLNDFVVKKEG